MNALIEADAIVNLDDAINDWGYEKWEDLCTETAIKALEVQCLYDGIYSLPWCINVEGIWYNKSVYDQYDLEEPTTWEEMEKNCDVLLENGVQPFSIAAADGQWITRFIQLYACYHEGANVVFDASLNRNGVSFRDQVFVDAAKRTQEMFEKGYFGTGFNAIDQTTAQQMMFTGTTAMDFDCNILEQVMSADSNPNGPDNIGFFHVPGFEKGGLSLEECNDIGLNATGLALCLGKNKYDEGTTKDFFAYLVSRYGEIQNSVGTISGFNVDVDTSGFTDIQKEFYEYTTQCTQARLWFEAYMTADTGDVAMQNAQLLAEGDMTPEAWCDALAQSVESYYPGE